MRFRWNPGVEAWEQVEWNAMVAAWEKMESSTGSTNSGNSRERVAGKQEIIHVQWNHSGIWERVEWNPRVLAWEKVESSSGNGARAERPDIELLPVNAGTKIDALPDCLLSRIFSVIGAGPEGGNALLSCKEVCKRWRQVVLSEENSLTAPFWYSSSLTWKRMAGLPNLHSLALDSISWETNNWPMFFRRLGQECKQLQTLTLGFVKPGLDQDGATFLTKNLTMLRSLSLWSSISSAKSLSLRKLTDLESLHIDDATLESLHIAEKNAGKELQLKSLRSLVLRGIGGLKALDLLNGLPNLEKIELHHLTDLETMPSFHGLSNLQTLAISGPYEKAFLDALHLADVPSLLSLTLASDFDLDMPLRLTLAGLTTLTNLRSLMLKGVMPEQPIDFSHLAYLEQLTVTVDADREPICLSGLLSLKELTIADGTSNEEASQNRKPADFCGLELTKLCAMRLSISHQNYEDLQDLTDLQSLAINASTFLVHQVQFPALTEVHLRCEGYGIEWQYMASGLQFLPNLTILFLVSSPLAYDLPHLGSPLRLQELTVRNFQWTEWALTEQFISLTHLYLNELEGDFIHIPGRARLQPLEGAPNLKELIVHSCDTHVLPWVSPLIHLRLVVVAACPYLMELPSLRELEELQELRVCDCDALAKLPDVSGLRSLRQLSVVGLKRLVAMPSLHGLQLHTLRISGCPQVTALPELTSLSSLRTLDLSGCELLEEVPLLRGLSRLVLVNLEGCNKLTTAPDKSGLSADSEIVVPLPLRT